MLPSNFERSLKTFSRRRPFRPFVVELTSGTRILVEHPEALAYFNGVAVYLAVDAAADEYMYFDHHSAARVGGNGTSKDPKTKKHQE